MSEIAILPEMIEAGVEALHECRDAGRSDEETVQLVYLAVESIKEMAEMRAGLVH